jgi:phosphoribulokinase
MSARHPIIAITGSSGAGTTTVTTTFQQIFRVKAVVVHGDAFHRYDRNEMLVQRAEAHNNGQMHFSRFGPEANLFEELETLFRVYGESGTGKVRKYLHDEEEAEAHQREPGTFTPWEEMPPDTDMLFYAGLHGARHRDRKCRAARRSPYRRRTRHQPRMDSETSPRQDGARLHPGGNSRYDSTPHA